jgi:hypothetical protein
MLKKNPPASRNCAITEGLRSKPHAQYRARCVHSDGLCLRRVVGKVLDLQSGEAGKHRAQCSSMSRIDGRIQFNPAEVVTPILVGTQSKAESLFTQKFLNKFQTQI